MGREFDLLIVDDDPDQLQLIEALVRELGLRHRCHYVASGPQAFDFLRRVPPFEKAPRPQLILLDLNMPGMNGCEVLRSLKSDVNLLSIPVIMLSNSQEENDINACYREHANVYLKKPADYEGTLALLRNINRFWAESALIPG